MAHDTNAIVLTDVVKTYEGGHPALDGFSLTVPAGAVFGFVGLNGAGKSTTVRLLAGLEHADSGIVEVLGVPVPFRDPAVKGKIGLVLDEPFYFDWLSAREYLTWIGRMEGLGGDESVRRTAELLDVLTLPSDEAQVIRTFSAGMKKKVSLAAAIIHAPELLILDEPLEAVDAVAARYLRDVLLSLNANGSTILLTSHVLSTVQHFCTHLCVIDSGKSLLQCPMAGLQEAARGILGTVPEESLEDIFIRLVTHRRESPRLSYV
jgi:ABC-2 type transport system ATP-binding protein